MKEKITAKNWIQNMNSYTIVYIKCLSVYWNLQHDFIPQIVVIIHGKNLVSC